MITAKTITLLVDLLALLFILFGFLIGLKRGLKSSVNRILLVLISAILAILVTRLISGSVLNISLPFLKSETGSSTSVNGYIDVLLKNYKLTDTITIASFTLTIEALVSIIKLVANVVIFVVLFELFRIISWIFYMIFFRTKKKDIIASKEAGTPINLHRWWGSLIGAFQGLFIFVFLLLPISGVSSIMADMSTKASAASTKEGAGIIETFVPEQYTPYVSVYENSIFNKAFGWTKIDEFMFDTLTTAKVDGAQIKLRNEVVSANKVVKTLNKYEIIDMFKNKKFNEKLNSLDDDEIREMFNDVFESTSNFTILKCFLVDASNVLANNLETKKQISVADINWTAEGKIFGDAMSDILISARPIIVAALSNGSKALTDEVLTSEDVDYELFGKGFDKLAEMQLIKDNYKEVAKKALTLEKVKEFGDKYNIDLSTINVENVSFAKTFKTIGGLLRIAVKLKDAPTLDTLTTQNLSELLDDIKESPEIAEQLNGVLVNTFQEEFGIDVPEDFNLFDAENPELLESTINTISSLESVETGENLTSEQAGEILSNVETMLENDNSEVILELISNAAGVTGTLPAVSEAKDAVTALNAFVSEENDDPAIIEPLAVSLVDALNSEPNLVTLLKFKGNKYTISSAKMDALDSASASSSIKALFIVAE